MTALVALCALAACASRGKSPSDALKEAEAAVARADEAHVGDYDALDLRAARAKLIAARNAAAQPDRYDAEATRWLAQEASADAEMAVAKARALRAKAVLQEAQRQRGIATTPGAGS